MAVKTWEGSWLSELQAEPVEAQIPARSRLINVASPSIKAIADVDIIRQAADGVSVQFRIVNLFQQDRLSIGLDNQ